ncbi:MAG: deoxyguanosinetriphosphate triphosphohydrolase [Pseudomonadota bacterium]|nr:MAG: deoxyguanosinetriphosphate triphosphohydrolase [Pseudomonadota bacterium]
MALAPYAASDTTSRGRRFSESAPSYRSEYQRDRDRIIHSAAFRRLEYKTQVFVNHEGDMYRTRLTHSIEVAQISRSIARILSLNEDLMETIALAHDLGHTPFGHAGQDALNEAMGEHGGFEHNLQSLRVVDKLELRYADFAGLNLTFESREGILKHCSVKNARILGDVGERFLDKRQPSLEAQAVNLADEIAYNSHDVDDGLRSQLISIEQLCEVRLFRQQYDDVTQHYPGIEGRQLVHEIVRRIINSQVVDLVETSAARITAAAPSDMQAVRQRDEQLISFSEAMTELNLELKRFLRTHLYRHFRVHRMSTKATHIVKSLFDAFMNDVRLLPPEHQRILHNMEEARGARGRARAVADYVAGMTDRYAIREYERIYSASELT